jgi:hypothetical protein
VAARDEHVEAGHYPLPCAFLTYCRAFFISRWAGGHFARSDVLSWMDEARIQLFRTARYIRRAKILVASLRARIEDMKAKGQSVERAETMLKAFEATQRALEEHERGLQEELNALEDNAA